MRFMLKLLFTLFISAFFIVGMYFLWHNVIITSMQQGAKTNRVETSRLNQEASEMRRALSTKSKQLFVAKQFNTPLAFNNTMHDLLKTHKTVVLLGLQESLPKRVTLTSAIGTNFTQFTPDRINKVKKIYYNMRLVGRFRALYELIDDVRKKLKGVFWESTELSVKAYPKLVVDLKFYILQK
jgi:hypothetical protein